MIVLKIILVFGLLNLQALANDSFESNEASIPFHTVTYSNFSCDIGLKIFKPPIKTQGYKIINSVPSPNWFPIWSLINRATELSYKEFLTLVTPDFIKINHYDKKKFEDILKSRRNIKLDKRPSYNTTFFYEVRVKREQKDISVVAFTLHLVDSISQVPDSIGLKIFLKKGGKWLVHDFMAEKDWLLKFPLSNLERMKVIASKDQVLRLNANGKFEPGL